MAHRWPARAVASVVAGTLIIGVIPGVANAAPGPKPTPNSADAAPASAVTSTLNTINMKPMGGLTPIVIPSDSVRAAGVGAFQVHVAQRSQPGIRAEAVRVSIRVAKGVTVTDAHGDDWSCTTGETIECLTPTAMSETSTPGIIFVTVSGAATLSDSSVAVKSTVTWTQRADAAYTAAKVPWPSTLGDPARIVEEKRTELVDLPTDARLGIQTRVAGPDVHYLGATGENALLEASVTGIEGTTVTTRWRQLCLTAEEAATSASCDGVAPPATFVVGQVDGSAAEWMAATVKIPPVSAPTVFVFEVTASEGGATATARARLRAEPFEAKTYDPRFETFATLEKSVKQAQAEEAAPLAGYAQESLVGRIGGLTGTTRVRAGQSTSLSMSVDGHRVTSTRWSASGAKSGSLGIVRKTRSAITLAVPRNFRDKTLLVKATATIEDGRTVSVDKFLTVATLRTAQSTKQPRAATFTQPGVIGTLRVTEDPALAELDDVDEAVSADATADDAWDSELDADVLCDDDDAECQDIVAEINDENDGPDSELDPDVLCDDDDVECQDIVAEINAENDGPDSELDPDVLCDDDDVECQDIVAEINAQTAARECDPEESDCDLEAQWAAEEAAAQMSMPALTPADIEKECGKDGYCAALLMCYADDNNFDDMGELTPEALANNVSCQQIQRCDPDSGQTCPFDLNVQARGLCLLASSLQSGKEIKIPFGDKDALTITEGKVSSRICDEKTQITFTKQQLQTDGLTLLVSGTITTTGITITGGTVVPPASWSEIDASLTKPMPFTMPAGSSAGAQMRVVEKDGEVVVEWTALTLTANLLGYLDVLDTPGGWSWSKSTLELNRYGVQILQEFTQRDWSGAIQVRLDFAKAKDTSVFRGEVTASNFVVLDSPSGSAGISVIGSLRWERPAKKPEDPAAPDPATKPSTESKGTSPDDPSTPTKKDPQTPSQETPTPTTPQTPTQETPTTTPQTPMAAMLPVRNPMASQLVHAAKLDILRPRVDELPEQSPPTQNPPAQDPPKQPQEGAPQAEPTKTDTAKTDTAKTDTAKADAAKKDDAKSSFTPGVGKDGGVYLSVFGTLDGMWSPLQWLSISDVMVHWGNDGFGVAMTGDAWVGDLSNPFPLGIDGTFVDRKNWEFEVEQLDKWKIPAQVPISVSDVKGTLSRVDGTVTFSVGGGVSDWTPGAGFSNVGATLVISNMCKPKKIAVDRPEESQKVVAAPEPTPEPRIGTLPAEDQGTDPEPPVDQQSTDQSTSTQTSTEKSPTDQTLIFNPRPIEKGKPVAKPAAKPKPKGIADCGALRMEIKIKANLTLPIVSDAKTEEPTKLAWTGTAKFRFKPFVYEIVGGVQVADGALGPKEFNLREIEITLTNKKTDSCIAPRLDDALEAPEMDEPVYLGNEEIKPSETTKTDAGTQTGTTTTESGTQTSTQSQTSTGTQTETGSGTTQAGTTTRVGALDPNTPADPATPTEHTAKVDDPAKPAEEPTKAADPAKPAEEPTKADDPAKATEEKAKQSTYFAIRAKGRIYGVDVTVAGNFGSKHLCLIAEAESLEGKDVSPELAALRKSLPASGRVLFVYTSMTQTLTTPAIDDSPERRIQLPGKAVAVIANVKLHEDMVKKLGFTGKATLTAVMSTSGFKGEIAVSIDNGFIISGKSDTNRMLLDGAALSIEASRERVAISVRANLSYVTVPGKDVAASTTPLTGEFKIAIEGGKFGVTLSAFVDVNRAVGQRQFDGFYGKEVFAVKDAFGVRGMWVRGLGVSMTIGTSGFEFAFNANVTLPPAWNKSIGFFEDTQVFLAFKISTLEPCVALKISRPPNSTVGPEATRQFAVDFGNKGYAYSRSLALVIAPKGCAFADGSKIAPGFGLEFDLAIGGNVSGTASAGTAPTTTVANTNAGVEPLEIRVKVNVGLPNGDDDKGFTLKTDISVPKSKIGDLVIDQTIIFMDIDTGKGVYKVRIKGGIAVWGQQARIDLDLYADKSGDLRVKGKGRVVLGFAAVVKLDAAFDVLIDVVHYKVNVFQLKANVDSTLLGFIHMGYDVDIDYSDGYLKKARAGFKALTPIAIKVSDENGKGWWITTGSWTFIYSSQKKGRTHSWKFAIGWDGKSKAAGTNDAYADKQIDMFAWRGVYPEVKMDSLMFNGCLIEPNASCVNGNLNGLVEYARGANRSVDLLSLAGADLSGITMSAEDFRDEADVEGMNFTGTNFSDANLIGTNFSKARLAGAKLQRARLIGADLSNADLSNADLSRAILLGANLKGANVTGTQLTLAKTNARTTCPDGQQGPCTGAGWSAQSVELGGCVLTSGAQCPGVDVTRGYSAGDLTGMNLSGSDLRGANLLGLDLSYADLTNVNLTGANLRGARLSDSVFVGTNVTGVKTDARTICPDGKLGPCTGDGWPMRSEPTTASNGYLSVDGCRLAPGASCSKANLSNTVITGVVGRFETDVTPRPKADLFNANLPGVNLSDSAMGGLRLTNANLAGANLSGAELEGASMRRANLAGANLSMTSLKNADLFKANLDGANLRYADIDGARLDLATTDAQTICPNGAAGPCSGDQWTTSQREQTTIDCSGIMGCQNTSRLPKKEMFGLDLSGKNFSGSDLSGANLSESTLSGASFGMFTDYAVLLAYPNAKPEDVTHGTRLENADLSDVTAVKTDFRGARMSGANLTGADLRRADFRGSTLTDALFDGAILDGAKTDAKTTCPSGKPGPCTGGPWDVASVESPVVTINGCDLVPSATCANAKLPAAVLADLDLSDADLRGAELAGADISGADLSGAKLVSVDLSQAKAIRTDLASADLGRSVLDGVDFTDAVLVGAKLNRPFVGYASRPDPVATWTPLVGNGLGATSAIGANFTRARLVGADVSGAALTDTNFTGARADNAKFAGASAQRMIATGASLVKADFTAAYVRQARFDAADLRDANFTVADLQGAVFSGARRYTGIVFQEADLSWADLSGMDLSNVDLRRANLTGANLRGAILRGALVQGADFTYAKLQGADMTGACVTTFTGLAEVDAKTIKKWAAPGTCKR